MLQPGPSKRAQHILSYAQSMRGGGVERALLRMIGGWIDQGRRVTLMLGSREGPLAAEIPAGVDLITLDDGRYRALLSVTDHVRRLRPDLIFCPGNHYSAIAAFTWLSLGHDTPPTVAKVSNALIRPEMKPLVAWGYRRWLRLHPRFLDHVVAMSPAMADEAVAAMKLPEHCVSVIANPPVTLRPDASPAQPPAGPYIIGVGRLEPQKRWDRLIAIVPRLSNRAISLIILGEGSERAALEKQIASLGLQDRVLLPGHVADPMPALADAQLAVLTSDYEGVPGVLREALALGTPVVSTDSSVAVREIVHAPELGSVVPRDDAEALVTAINYWLAPGRVRPAPIAAQGDSIADYLTLFDALVDQRIR